MMDRQSLTSVLQTHFNGVKLPQQAFAQPDSIRLVGTCGDGQQRIHHSVELSAFIDRGGGLLVGKNSIEKTLVAEVRPGGPFKFDHSSKGDGINWLSWECLSIAAIFSDLSLRQLWWFEKLETSPDVELLLAKVRPNPHFPADEVDLLPDRIVTEAGEHATFGACSTTVEQISCYWSCMGAIDAYTKRVPTSLQSLQRISIKAGNEGTPTPSLVEALAKVFDARSHVSAHTLVLDGVTTAVAVGVVSANFEHLSRLVLEKCLLVDFNHLLGAVAENKHLEVLSFKCSSSMDAKTLDLVRQCGHISFEVDPDLSLPPPRAAAALPNVPLPEPMKPGAFSALCKGYESTVSAPLGLVTAYGQVVPLAKDLVPRFQLLHAMLKDLDDDENLVPMELDPPVGKESVALAVHFVSHYVSEEVNKECEKAEMEQPRSGPSFSWCAQFQQFLLIHIRSRYGAKRRIQIMCELMALATFLNCAALKRFLRAGLVIEEMNESHEAERGKRNR